MSLRPSYILGLLLLAAPLAAAPSLTPMVNLTVDSAKVQYNGETQIFTTEGPTEIRAEVEGAPERRVLVKAPATRTDLQAGTVEASQGVQFVIPRAYLSGDSLSLQTTPRAFSLEQAQAVIDLAPAGEPIVLGQMQGKRIYLQGTVLVLEDGMVSPCTREHPHVAFRVRRLEYDQTSRRVRLRGASLDLYGLRVPLLPSWTHRLGPRQSSRGVLPTIGYAKRDGLYVPYYFDFTHGSSDRLSDLSVRLTAKRGITFLGEQRVTRGRWTGRAWASRMEDVRDKLEANLVHDRLPELRLTGHQRGPEQDQGWKLGVSLGNFFERDEAAGAPPEVHRLRARLGLGYNWGGRAQARREGRWASVWSTGAIYSQGESYTDTVLTLGTGRRFSPAFQGDLQYLHHFESGATPFQFDRVDLARELRPRMDWQMSPTWRLVSFGRYDTAQGRLRDYGLELSKRTHCLTWTGFYSFIGARLGLRVDLSGLTGGTAPPPLTGPLAEQYLQSQEDLNRPLVP